MGKSAVSGVMWLGKAAVFAVGLAVIVIFLFVAAKTVLGANGGPVLSSDPNQIDPVSRLVGGDAAADQALAVEPVARRRQIEVPSASSG